MVPLGLMLLFDLREPAQQPAKLPSAILESTALRLFVVW